MNSKKRRVPKVHEVAQVSSACVSRGAPRAASVLRLMQEDLVGPESP